MATATPRARSLRPTAIAVGAVVLVGAALRLWVMTRPVGVLDSDGAVVGLMARHVWRGELPVFYWGQAYGASFEALAAAIVTLGRANAFALKLTPVLLSGAAGLLTLAVGRRTVGPTAARVGAAVFWVGSAGMLWWSTKIGTYWASLCLTLVATLAVVSWTPAPRWSGRRAAMIGLSFGVCWWSNAQTYWVLVPVALVALPTALRSWRVAPVALVGFLVGAAPWIAFNVRNDWPSLEVPPQPAVPNSYLDHIEGFFRHALPMVLGFQVPFHLEWLPPIAGSVLYVAVLVVLLGTCAVALRRLGRRRRGDGLLWPAAVFVAYPFLFALSPLSWYVDQPRYLLMLWPFAALLVGAAVASLPARRVRPAAVATVAGAAVLAVAGLVALGRGNVVSPYAPDVHVPADTTEAHRLLRRANADYAFADYWIAYRLTYEEGERVIVEPATVPRYGPYARAARADRTSSWVVLRRSKSFAAVRDALARKGLEARVYEGRTFAVFAVDGRLLPEDVGPI